MTPSLHHLVEDHFKPKWWQFWRKQKYHVCHNNGIYEVPTKCVILGKSHSAKLCATIGTNEVVPDCGGTITYGGCPPLKASDPNFFKKLDEYLAHGCHIEKHAKHTPCVSGPLGISGFSGVSGMSGYKGLL